MLKLGVGVAMATQFTGAVVGGALIGRWLEQRYDFEPWGLIAGSALGLIGGVVGLVRVGKRLAQTG